MSDVITYEQLEELVLTGTPEKIRQTFANYTEQQRKSLSVKAGKLRTQLVRNKANKDASEKLKLAIKKQGEFSWNSKAQINACIAVFAVCPLSTLKKTDFYMPTDDHASWREVISDRKPDWLDDWLEYDLTQEFGRTSFEDVFAWMEAGICSKPSTDGYFQKFAMAMMSFERDKDKPQYPPISERLKRSPILLDDIWSLFKVETYAFNTESWLTNNAPENYETWTQALLKLSADGTVSRSRLLNASLSGLQEDLKQNQLSGFHKFHTKLTPTKQELQLLQPEYLALLCHPVGHVVKFALAMLTKIEKNGDLDIAVFLAESTSVFMQDAKGNATATLKLIKKLIRAHAELIKDCLTAASEGLKHQSADVQEAALDIIESEWNVVDETLRDELYSNASYTSAAIKARLLRLLDVEDDTPERAPEQRCTIDEYAPLSSDITQLEVLPFVDKIVPIDNIEQLISALSHAVEVVDTPDDVERIIDAISRLCDNKPDNFEDLISPLKYRLSDGGGFATSNGIANAWGGIRLSLADLIMTWMTGKLHRSTNSKYFSTTQALIPAVMRITKIAERVSHNLAAQTLAAPTHVSGWIDPEVWVSRLAQMKPSHLKTDREDFCLSLLRLAPDNRAQALSKTKNLPKTIKRIVQFALGGEAIIKSSDKSDYELWISAARCRDPQKGWNELFNPIGIKDTWPDSVNKAEYSWNAYVKQHRTEHSWGGKTHVSEWKTPEFEIDIGIDEKGKVKSSEGLMGKIKGAIQTTLNTDWRKIPTAAMSHSPEKKDWWNSDFVTPWVAHWLTFQWPQYPESAYATGARQLASRIDDNSSAWEPNYGFLSGLFVKNRPWHEPGHLLLCIGLAGKDADSRGLAIDAFIEGVDNRCLDVQTISQVLIKLSERGWLKLNRLGDNLMQISQVSEVHRWAVKEIIANWLIQASPKQNNFFKMLEVFQEVLIATETKLAPEVREVLADIKGSSKPAKLAKKIIASVGT